jgi:hypothetical protein
VARTVAAPEADGHIAGLGQGEQAREPLVPVDGEVLRTKLTVEPARAIPEA